jgi:alkaline phosphatase
MERPDGISYNTGPNFPLNWNPRYAIAAGFGANPDHRENYAVHTSPRGPSSPIGNATEDNFVTTKDAPDGFVVNGTIPVSQPQGVHSLTDVPVYAMGPCQEIFGGTYNNIDIFYKFATCFGLGQPKSK